MTDLVTLHHLDLPNLLQKPSHRLLCCVLSCLSPEVHAFGELSERQQQIELDAQDLSWLSKHSPVLLSAYPFFSPVFKQSFTRPDLVVPWLTRVVASPLSWLAPQEREEVLELACEKVAEYTSPFRSKSTVREVQVGQMKVRLNEPGFQFDSLGFKTWGASHQLANYFATHTTVADPILELGSGTGLVGITLAKLGYRPTLTDLPEILHNLQTNVELNEVAADVHALDWTAPEGLAESSFASIIVCDCIYSDVHPLLVREMVDKYLAPRGTVYLQLPIRKGFSKEREKIWELMNHMDVIEELNTFGKDDFGLSEFNLRVYQARRNEQVCIN